MPEERIKSLNELGFRWSLRDYPAIRMSWDELFNKLLAEFKRKDQGWENG